MPMTTKILCAAAALCALSAGTAVAQEHKSTTNITITDDGKKRHIVVEKDGKIVRDEWTTSEPNKGFSILRDGSDGRYRIERSADRSIVIADGKARRLSVPPGATIVQSGKDGQYRIERAKDGTVIVSDGKASRVTAPSVATTVRVGKDGKYRLERSDAATRVRSGAKQGRFYTAPDVTVGRKMVRGQDIAKLLKSLNFDQREKQHDRGYLTLDDLTPQQRSLFNAPEGNNWTVSYEIDGNKVTIRSR